MKILITGQAGMIGFHLAKLLKQNNSNYEILGLDSFNDYYEIKLKYDRCDILKEQYGITTHVGNLCTMNLDAFLHEHKPDMIIHLAAYANPRHSMLEPYLYIDNNITGTQKLVEACEKAGIENVIFASSSCVMHGQDLPWNEVDKPDHQNNPYGWSKRVNECQFRYSKIARTMGLRFFTVYGPYGRPDMALFSFTNNIVNDKPIVAFNNGEMYRDFTYVDDIIAGIDILVKKMFKDTDKYKEIYNIGFGEKVYLMDFIKCIEHELGKKAIIDYQPAHPADVPATWSDTSKLQKLGYKPSTPIDKGVHEFIKWYKEYYNI